MWGAAVAQRKFDEKINERPKRSRVRFQGKFYFKISKYQLIRATRYVHTYLHDENRKMHCPDFGLGGFFVQPL
jgi:hypothetical protein